MRNTTPHLKRSALTQATLAGLALLVAMPVLAQSETTDEEKKKEEERVTQIEAVQVTGSRIFRAGFDTLEPATVVTREKIEQRGITNIADALNEIPGFGTGVTPEGGQSTFGVGVNFVNRLGLGTNRTLSLINGRRVVTSNPGTIFGPAAPGVQVDLNAIPAQLVERIENIAIGGAPTYGSDAIAGVVNVITRRDYEGAEVSATYGITDRDDNQRKSLSARTSATASATSPCRPPMTPRMACSASRVRASPTPTCSPPTPAPPGRAASPPRSRTVRRRTTAV